MVDQDALAGNLRRGVNVDGGGVPHHGHGQSRHDLGNDGDFLVEEGVAQPVPEERPETCRRKYFPKQNNQQQKSQLSDQANSVDRSCTFPERRKPLSEGGKKTKKPTRTAAVLHQR